MRLTELNPEWLYGGGEGVTYGPTGEPVPRHTAGLVFDCPCGCGSRRSLTFQNPPEPGIPGRNLDRGWKREGTTFEGLTLKPSIYAKWTCGWHGYVTNGEVSGWMDAVYDHQDRLIKPRPESQQNTPVSRAPVRTGGNSPRREDRMGKQLDRNKKYATTYGEDARRYYQDGVYFDAAGEEIVSEPVATREEPPLGAGQPAGKTLPGATSASVDSSGAPATATDDELRAQLGQLAFIQVKKLFKAAGGPDDVKGAGAQARMVDWLVTNRDKMV